ncbi:hypothetical protein [Candidatus Enterococcus murrayae]|uniref:Transposase n=1 Tax=Candidatus Enterococcus murrayae TaxID=2815321 RepID=A0ABS3HHA4_9ENTE|nr:hypothetical protein [Enterococcus sp. MJM16]MBO0452825.1 hypothetical protein [Enterococcus sp. MJM16]
MEDYGLSRRQLFTLTRKTLERRVTHYYKKTNDGNGAIQILVALQVRDELEAADFSMLLKRLVRHIFLQTRSTAAMRRFYSYFAAYFEKKEWRLLTIKLFPAKTYIAEKIHALYTQFIKEPLAGLAGS